MVDFISFPIHTRHVTFGEDRALDLDLNKSCASVEVEPHWAERPNMSKFSVSREHIFFAHSPTNPLFCYVWAKEMHFIHQPIPSLPVSMFLPSLITPASD